MKLSDWLKKTWTNPKQALRAAPANLGDFWKAIRTKGSALVGGKKVTWGAVGGTLGALGIVEALDAAYLVGEELVEKGRAGLGMGESDNRGAMTRYMAGEGPLRQMVTGPLLDTLFQSPQGEEMAPTDVGYGADPELYRTMLAAQGDRNARMGEAAMRRADATSALLQAKAGLLRPAARSEIALGSAQGTREVLQASRARSAETERLMALFRPTTGG